MNIHLIYAQKFADAAMQAIAAHWEQGIGMRSVTEWDDSDVIDPSLLVSALADYGLDRTADNEQHLENIVSPVVFRKWYADPSGQNHATLLSALGYLHAGGVNTFQLNRLQKSFEYENDEPAINVNLWHQIKAAMHIAPKTWHA